MRWFSSTLLQSTYRIRSAHSDDGEMSCRRAGLHLKWMVASLCPQLAEEHFLTDWEVAERRSEQQHQQWERRQWKALLVSPFLHASTHL